MLDNATTFIIPFCWGRVIIDGFGFQLAWPNSLIYARWFKRKLELPGGQVLLNNQRAASSHKCGKCLKITSALDDRYLRPILWLFSSEAAFGPFPDKTSPVKAFVKSPSIWILSCEILNIKKAKYIPSDDTQQSRHSTNFS